MTAAPAALRRVRRPDGRPVWLWRDPGGFRDLSAAGLAGELTEAAAWLHAGPARQVLLDAAPVVAAGDWPLLRPGRPGKALCLGRNFAAHAREFGAEPPEELVWFAKLPDVLVGPGAAVEIPAWLRSRVDPEAEVVALVGRALRRAAPEEAAAAICAWTLGNDVTARGQQGADRQRGWPWLRAKNLATFGPLGPEWVPADAAGDPADFTLRGLVNGELRQEASLAGLIWSPGRALAEISRWTPLCPGDLVFLGTPAGVAPIRPGDRLTVEAEGLGRLENPVAAAED